MMTDIAHQKLKLPEVTVVLWGTGGDEAAAIIFTSELRAAGFSVKLVGLGGAKIKGRSGIVLVPDMTLGDALSLGGRVVRIIFPFKGNTLKHFTTDPRLQAFLSEAHQHGAIFIQSEQIAKSTRLPKLFDLQTPIELLYYPDGEALYRFVHDLGWSTEWNAQES